MTPEAQYAFQQKGVNERLARLERPPITPPDVPFHMRMVTHHFGLTTQTTFSIIFRQAFPRAYYDGLYLEFPIIASADRAGEVRLTEVNSGAVTSTLSVPAATDATAQFKWLHGQPTDVSIATQQFLLAIQARKITTGGGDFEIYPPTLAIFMSSELLETADSTGMPAII